MSNFRYLNGAAIAYAIVSVLAAVVLVGIDSKLPVAFVIALTSLDFWLRYARGAAVFVGIVFILMLILYIKGGRIDSQRKAFIPGLLGAFLCAILYGTTLSVLMLTGLRH